MQQYSQYFPLFLSGFMFIIGCFFGQWYCDFVNSSADYFIDNSTFRPDEYHENDYVVSEALTKLMYELAPMTDVALKSYVINHDVRSLEDGIVVDAIFQWNDYMYSGENMLTFIMQKGVATHVLIDGRWCPRGKCSAYGSNSLYFPQH